MLHHLCIQNYLSISLISELWNGLLSQQDVSNSEVKLRSEVIKPRQHINNCERRSLNAFLAHMHHFPHKQIVKPILSSPFDVLGPDGYIAHHPHNATVIPSRVPSGPTERWEQRRFAGAAFLDSLIPPFLVWLYVYIILHPMLQYAFANSSPPPAILCSFAPQRLKAALDGFMFWSDAIYKPPADGRNLLMLCKKPLKCLTQTMAIHTRTIQTDWSLHKIFVGIPTCFG